MRRLEKLTKIIIMSMILCIFLLFSDIVILAYLSVKTDDGLSQPPVSYIAGQLQKTNDERSEVQYTLSQEAMDKVDSFQGFVFLLDDQGKVIWSYKLPEDVPEYFTLKQVVQFTRFYLNDYPVFTHIMDEGIIVVGTPKNSTWKYNLVFQITTMDMLKNTLPVMLIVNLFILLAVPFLLIRHDARRREKERTTWIAGVSHDIRTPLSLVLGYADEILRIIGSRPEPKKVTDIADRAQVIEEQAVRIRTLVTNLNTENKLTYGMGSWRKEELLLPAVIRDIICEVLNRKLDDKYDINVIISESLEQLYIKGNEELIKRLMENLINNAMNHNSQGCEITIRLTRCNNLMLKRHILEVSDNGCGVSKKQLKSFRTSIKSDKLPEHGLGIRLVRQIAAFHHWRVHFLNNENGGFCCRMYF